jgi:hypothetical protein
MLGSLAVDSPEEEAPGAWKQDLAARIEEIVDRKRSSGTGRETSLAQYVYILMSHYAYDQIQSQYSELFPSFLKSIKGDSSEKEITLALRGMY